MQLGAVCWGWRRNLAVGIFSETKCCPYVATRAKFIKNVKYDVNMAVMPGKLYFGSILISFDLEDHPDLPIFLDYTGKVARMIVNTD